MATGNMRHTETTGSAYTPCSWDVKTGKIKKKKVAGGSGRTMNSVAKSKQGNLKCPKTVQQFVLGVHGKVLV